MTILTFQNFTKRRNSTKTPLDSAGTSVNVNLKDSTSIESPVFELASNDFTINYVKAFGAYYFVTDIVSVVNGIIELHCSKDVLATYKSEIGSYSGFIEYTSSSSDLTIMDPRNRPTCNVRIRQANQSTGLPLSGVGSYIIGVISDSVNGSAGPVQYYGMTPTQTSLFMQEVFNTNGFWDRIKEQFNDTMASIVSCVWVPFTNLAIPNVFGNETAIKIGDQLCTATGRPLLYRIMGPNNPIVLTLDYPYSALGPSYLDRSPYSSATLYLPFVGNVPIDIDALFTTRTISVDFKLDVITGDILYRVLYSDINADYHVSTYSGNLATKVPITGSSYDAIGEATGLMAAAGGIAATVGAIVTGAGAPAVLGTVGAALGGAGMAARSLEHHSMIQGGASSALGAVYGQDIIVTVFTQEPAEPNLTRFQTEQGMPFFQVAQISSQSGFVKCSAASVPIAGEAIDKETVNAFLNGGFYYE